MLMCSDGCRGVISPIASPDSASDDGDVTGSVGFRTPPETMSPPRRYSSPDASSEDPSTSGRSRRDRASRGCVSFSDALHKSPGISARSKDALGSKLLRMEAAALRRSLANAELSAWSQEPPANPAGLLAASAWPRGIVVFQHVCWSEEGSDCAAPSCRWDCRCVSREKEQLHDAGGDEHGA
jgi:hypothetical protein